MNLKNLKFLTFFILSIYNFNILYAQDAEPRRSISLPLGSKFIAVGYGYKTEDVAFDLLLEVEDAIVEVNYLIVSYIQPFKIGNKLARFDV